MQECERDGLKAVYLPNKRYLVDAKRQFRSAMEGIPLDGQNIARMATLTDLRSCYDKAIFVSDVSAELTIAARTLGFPTVMMRHSGSVDKDPTQSFAYSCSEFLFAPFPEALEDTSYSDTCETVYLGFLSEQKKALSTDLKKGRSQFRPGISYLSSPSDFNVSVLAALAKHYSHVQVIGLDQDSVTLPDDFAHERVQFRGYVDDIRAHVDTEIVVSAAGNNAVGELLQLGKKMILLPQQRPYDEQEAKAAKLAELGLAAVFRIDPSIDESFSSGLGKPSKRLAKQMKAAIEKANQLKEPQNYSRYFSNDETMSAFIERLHSVNGNPVQDRDAVLIATATCH